MTDPIADSKIVETVIRMLSTKQMPREGPFWENALKWVTHFPGHIDQSRKRVLMEKIQWCFSVEEAELYSVISGLSLPPPKHTSLSTSEDAFDARIPKEGWLRNYVEYTRFCEAPMPYHVFASLVVLGASVGRRVRLESGHYNTYPNLCVLLIGPPGRLKKSTCVGIARKLVLKANLCNIFPDKATPEAFVSIIKEKPHQFIGAPELSVFLGRQKYNEGLVTLMLRLLDTEDMPVDVATIVRGEEPIENHCLCMIGGSTMSLLTSATADQVASSGFLSRFVPVVEEDTPRCFPEPVKGGLEFENRLLMTLDWMKCRNWKMTLSPAAKEWYKAWYVRRWEKMRTISDDTLVQIQERGAEHMKRIAMLLHLADHKTEEVCVSCLEIADWLLQYAEHNIPKMVSAINKTTRTTEIEYVLEQIRKHGGAVDHSKLLRGLSSRGIDAAMMKNCLSTLKERKEIRDEKRGNLHFYILEEGV